MRLLIVDDSDLMRKATRLAFRSAHELHEAIDGVDALAQLALARQPFDAIVLDLHMPGMNGVEFLRALQQRHPDLPVVVASSEPETSPALQEVRDLGVTAVLRKPWKPQELARAVEDAVGSKRSDR